MYFIFQAMMNNVFVTLAIILKWWLYAVNVHRSSWLLRSSHMKRNVCLVCSLVCCEILRLTCCPSLPSWICSSGHFVIDVLMIDRHHLYRTWFSQAVPVWGQQVSRGDEDLLTDYFILETFVLWDVLGIWVSL